MKLSATFIEWAWKSHEACVRWREAGNVRLAEYFEGTRDALRFSAKLARANEQ